jgi:hypothetical protein
MIKVLFILMEIIVPGWEQKCLFDLELVYYDDDNNNEPAKCKVEIKSFKNYND